VTLVFRQLGWEVMPTAKRRVIQHVIPTTRICSVRNDKLRIHLPQPALQKGGAFGLLRGPCGTFWPCEFVIAPHLAFATRAEKHGKGAVMRTQADRCVMVTKRTLDRAR
jgi:hypothetical protein